MNRTLYKKDTKGKIRVLIFSTVGSMLIQESGLLDGKMVRNERECHAKNAGRANATTVEEQAIFEMESKYTAKLKEGYFKSIEEAQTSVNLMPMLAKTAKLEELVYPVIVQPKLDGMRMMASSVSKLSRKNTPIDTLDHIDTSWLHEQILDGEVYRHGFSFQENMKVIKKVREGTEMVKFHVYDLPLYEGGYQQRHQALTSLVEGKNNIEIVPYFIAGCKEDVLKLHQSFIDEGYEGSMLRLDNGIQYEFGKRSKSLLKFKDFIDEAYEIVDVVASDRRPSEGVVMCKDGKGNLFGCNMKMSIADRIELLNNKNDYIGKVAEVRFFEFSDDGVPRFPVFVGVRLDKKVA